MASENEQKPAEAGRLAVAGYFAGIVEQRQTLGAGIVEAVGTEDLLAEAVGTVDLLVEAVGTEDSLVEAVKTAISWWNEPEMQTSRPLALQVE